MKMNELIQRMYTCGKETRPVVYELMSWIMAQLMEGNINQLNQLYTTLDVAKLDIIFLALVLRPSSSYSSHLPAWEPFRRRAIAEAKIRFPDSWEGAFMGLIDMKETGSAGYEGAFDKLIGIHPSISRQ